MTYVHKGDIGLEITVSTGKDLTAVSTTQLKVKKPSGTTVTWTASVVSPATGGNLLYTTVSGDLNETGWYYLESYLVFADGDTLTGDTVKFRVYDDYEEV